jgi:hypothetical protein
MMALPLLPLFATALLVLHLMLAADYTTLSARPRHVLFIHCSTQCSANVAAYQGGQRHVQQLPPAGSPAPVGRICP